ncbi:MAG TPA: hypothetical protein VFV33_26335, partial [Gemmatimonadaceae bacterium]|nr:hypothetical protein [Gemmatimonadaceae bacterium]
VRVQVAGRTVDLAFSPSAYTGKKNQIVIPGEEVKPKEHADVRVEKKGKGLAFASATWHFSTEKLPAAEQGDFFQVSRRYFIRAAKGNEVTLRPLGEGEALKPGDEVEVQLSIRSKHAAEYVHLQDPRAAGLEPDRATSGYKWDLGLAYYEETRDSATNFFFDWLPAGEYTLRYRVRASMAGSFRIGPATLQSLYAPEFNAYSAGQQLQIAGTQR